MIEAGRLEEQNPEQLLLTARRLLAEAEALSSRIAAVNEIGIAINRRLDLDKILKVVAKQAKWLLDFQYCGVCLRNRDSLWAVTDLFGFSSPCAPSELSQSSNLGYVLRTGNAFLATEKPQSSFLRNYESQMILPLVNDSEVMGAICFAAKSKGCYRQEDVRIAHLLALQLAAALRNARHLEDMRNVEDSLRRYAEELEERNAELDAYSHTIAHDLKSPLTSIPLRTFMIEKLEPDLKPETIKQLSEIKLTVSRMGGMIDQLLWLAKVRDAHEVAVCVEIAPVVEAAVSRFSDSIEKAGIKIIVEPDLPAVKGHSQWLEEVFANLINNAIKYMGSQNPEPSITVRGIRQGDMVRYEIEDTGLGIAEDQQAHLFEMFTRAHVNQADGLGLGLSIVHRIINNLKGEVGVTSTPGVGSTFWFKLAAGNQPD